MKRKLLFYVRTHHESNFSKEYTIPVLADTRKEAIEKARLIAGEEADCSFFVVGIDHPLDYLANCPFIKYEESQEPTQ